MADRRLSPEERALWLRVAGSVRALKPMIDSVDPAADTPARLSRAKSSEAAPASRPPTSLGTNGKGAPSVASNTLDGSWDRSIDKGRIVPDRTIDLHGCTLDQAHVRLERELHRAIAAGVRVVLLVAGKAPRAGASRIDLPLRGIIRASVGDWMAASRHAGHIAAVRTAHPRHGGAGALYVILRRPQRSLSQRQN